MKQTNWHWDLQLPVERITQILKNDQDPSFVSVAARLLSRNDEPQEVFSFITPLAFCRRFSAIQREIKKDEWTKEKAAFWKATYHRYLKEFRQAGVRVREQSSPEVDELTQSILEKMRVCRDRAGLSQRELARRMGYSQQFVSGIESGREKVTLAYLQKFAEATDSRFDLDLYPFLQPRKTEEEYRELFSWRQTEHDKAIQEWGDSITGKALMEILAYCPDRLLNARMDQWDVAESIASETTIEFRRNQLKKAMETSQVPSQAELRQAMEDSQVHSFGWPIGVVMDRDDYKPKPIHDGIRAIIPVRGESYDYWTLRNDGVFYLFQTFFEDKRAKGKIFLDTRIVRTAEAVLRIAELYERLGVSSKHRVAIRLRYSGLNGRELATADPRRHIRAGHVCIENEVETVIREDLAALKPKLVELTHRAVSDLTRLFDYFEPSRGQVVRPLLRDFFKGELSVQ